VDRIGELSGVQEGAITQEGECLGRAWDVGFLVVSETHRPCHEDSMMEGSLNEWLFVITPL
jgi:hypothetical protein